MEVNAEEENDVGHEFDHITDTKEEENVSSHSRTEENTSNPNQQRCRRPPLWIEYYETREGVSEGNVDVNLAMFVAGNGDPTYFDDAVKIEKWRKAMNVKMKAIKRNGTRELMELPKGAKKVGVK